MNKLSFTLLVVSLLFAVKTGFADSPITATNFYEAYLDVPIVKNASQNKDVLTTEQMEYLFNENNPLDIKMALINAIGWEKIRLDTYEKFLNFVQDKLNQKDNENAAIPGLGREELYERVGSDLLVIMAYLKAMTDYNDMTLPMELIEKALQKDYRNCQSFMIPVALIKAEEAVWNNEAETYPVVEKYLLLAPIHDVRRDAINIIMQYICLYKEYM